MTRQEQTGLRDLTFSQWMRDNLPDSYFEFYITDVDFVLFNPNTKKVMLLEVKTRNAEVKSWQRNIFFHLAKWISRGINDGWTFMGFRFVRFENNFFNDGKCYLDNKEINEKELKHFLSII